jgi:DnaJ domain
MGQREGEVENLAHAYRVLDVPWSAPSRVIKLSYRKLVKRWHPDRHRPGTTGHTEATLMTSLLNESYARIAHAPLRAGCATPFSSGAADAFKSKSARTQTSEEPDPSGSAHSEYIPRDSSADTLKDYRMFARAREMGARDDAARPFDWVGFAVRFVLGALFGGVLSFRVMTDWWLGNRSLIPFGMAATILFCALASGFGGDAFWRSIRPGGWWWKGRWD